MDSVHGIIPRGIFSSMKKINAIDIANYSH